MRKRILVSIVGVAAGAVALLAVPLGIGAQQLYRNDELIELERVATAAARNVDAEAAPRDPVEFSASSDELAAYGADGKRLGGEGPREADSTVTATLESGSVVDAEPPGSLEVVVPVLARERVVGAIRALRSTEELSERVLRARLLLGGGAVLIIAAAVAAALSLSRRITEPLRALAGAAARVGEGDFSARAPRDGTTELDTVADALDRTAAKLDELITRERAFSADASHQLRTPLSALRLELESRQMAGADLADALAQVERLERTIDTLLAAARDLPLEREPFEVRAVVEEARLGWHGRLAAKGRALEVLAEPAPKAVASREAVSEILEILLDNAARHGSGAVRMRVRALGGQIAIDVSDQGSGIDIDPEAAFSRRSDSRHGIGLALARSLAEAEAGLLSLTENGPSATTFTLLLGTARPDG